MTVPDEAIEAAIGALSPTDAAAIYPDAMRAALEAAAPYLRAQALEDAADAYRHYEAPNARLYLRARAAAERGGE